MFPQWLKKLAARWCQPQRRYRADAVRRRRFACMHLEPLEDRAVPAVITWTNRGDASHDTDGFTAAYGAWDSVARNIVDAAIDAWENTIESFNYSSGPDEFTLTVTAEELDVYPLPNVTLGRSQITDIDSLRKPTEGWVKMDIDHDWFFDQTPRIHEEFDVGFGPLNSRVYVATSSLDLDYDFYTVVLHELGHNLGFNTWGGGTAINDFVTPSGDDLTFTGPTIVTTLTGDGFHTHDGALPDDLMSSTLGENKRRLITGHDVAILADAYGYTVNRPPTMDELTAVVHFDAATGRLTVEGDQGPTRDDTIVIVRQGDDVKVTVNTVDYFRPVMDITDGIWIETRAGLDSVTVDLTGGQPVPNGYIFVNGGNEFDSLHVNYTGSEGYSLSLDDNSIDGVILADGLLYKNVESISISLDAGNDIVTVEGTIPETSISSSVSINTRGGADQINLQATLVDVTVKAGNGADTINVGSGLNRVSNLHGTLDIHGQGGGDNLFFLNQQAVAPGEYRFNGGAIAYETASHTDLEIIHTSIEAISITAGDLDDVLTVIEAPPGVQLTFDGGGASRDKLIAPDTLNDWHIDLGDGGTINDNIQFYAVEHLVGGAADDRFHFIGGNVRWKVEGGATSTHNGGFDTLDYSADKVPITVNVQARSATRTGGYIDIQKVIGSLKSLDDTIIGPDLDTTWQVLDANEGLLDWTASNVTGLLEFELVENLTGGAKSDRFGIADFASVSGKVDGRGDNDTLNYSQFNIARPVEVNLKTGLATATGSFANIEELIGGHSLSDRLLGKGSSTAESVWAITTDNSGSVTTGPAVVRFTDIENLTGDIYQDQFQFSNGASVYGMVSGGNGVDHLNYTQFGAGSVTVNLMLNTATATGGVNSIEALTGNNAATLIGPTGKSTWTLTGPDAGNVNGKFTFANVQNLTAPGTGQFVFQANSGLSGSLDAGTDGALDYSAFHRSIKVNLGAGTATGVSGGISNVRDITGTIYEDKLTGDAGNNVLRGGGGGDELKGLGGDAILLGGDGDDTLEGGAGRDLLFGGAGADQLNGGIGEDLLIGGTTAYDANDAALLSILDAWRGPGLYQNRISLIRDVGVGSGHYKLDSTTVFDDNVRDTLTGGSDLDWFWATRRDTTDRDTLNERLDAPGSV